MKRFGVPLVACLSLAVHDTPHAQLAGPTAAAARPVVRAATVNTSPIVLSGDQSLTISDPDYTLKNNITLSGNSTLIIRNANFTQPTDFFDQFLLKASDNARVIVEGSTIRGPINWKFYDSASLQMTDVTNIGVWGVFAGRSTTMARNVSDFRGTLLDSSSVDVDGAPAASVEAAFPAGSTVDESWPSSVGSTAYVFPNDGERGINFRLKLANVGPTSWGVTIFPESNITFRDTSVGIGLRIPNTYSGLTVQLDNLKARLYADDSWSFANGTIRLKNTTTGAWYPAASGDNRLILTNSTLSNMDLHDDRAQVSISDSTLVGPLARNFVRIDIARSFVNGDVNAIDNGIVTLTDTVVGGRLIQQGNGRVVATRVLGLGKGFHGFLTGDPSEVISGRASVKGAYFGTESFWSVLVSDPAVIRLSANQTYRVTFKYRVVTAPSRGFDVEFLSAKGIGAGNFLPGLTINGRDGETGTATLTTRLGPYDDYYLKVGIIATGAIVIDDIELADAGTGQVVASEGGETPIDVDIRTPAAGSTLTILPAALPTLTVGVPVSIALTVVGGTGTGLVFEPNGVGTQIPGLFINTPSPGMLSGTPTTAGPYTRGFTVTDSAGNTGTVVYTGTVLPAR